MTALSLYQSSCRLVLSFSLFTLSLFADTGLITKNHFPKISASGTRLESIFDGRAPNDYVRTVVLLRIDHREPFPLSDPSRRAMDKMFRRQLVSETPAFQGCPEGGVCASPGTISVQGQDCRDETGCLVVVDDQASSDDFTQGTQENYECLQCCIDWQGCTIGGDGGGPEPPIPPGPSPIIIDTGGEGFHLTNAAGGVLFDMNGSGYPIQMGWTDARFHNAFLALPGPDGLVHNGTELFGNFTPQPKSSDPNGFIALAQYDKPENGGNGDGTIDNRDAIFPRLRLWIDENHDGVAQSNELHRLIDFGVYSLSLKFAESRRTDEFGNQFRFKAQVNPGEQRDRRDQTASGEPGRWTFDVFFTLK